VDVVITFGRDTNTTAPQGCAALKLRVEKNRHGLTGREMRLLLNGDRCRIEEWDSQDSGF
jgi:hypothetical protein